MNRRRFGLAVALSVSLLAGRAWSDEPPVTIGLIDMYSGAFAFQTEQIRLGFQIALDQANAAGGVKGRHFALQTADMGTSVEKAITEGRRMIDNDHLKYVTLGSHAGAAIALGQLIKGRKDVFLLGGIATSKHFTGEVGGPMMGRANWSTVELGRIMADYLKSMPEVKRLATISPDFEFGHDYVDDFAAAVKVARPDIQIVRQQWPKLGTLDFTPDVTAIQAANVDMIVSGLFGGDFVNFSKAATSFGLFDGKMKFWAHGADLVKMSFVKDSLPDGTLVNLWYPFYALNSAENTAFVDEVKKRSNSYPVGATLVGYVAGTMMTQAIIKGGNPDDPMAASKAMDGLGFSTPVGPAKVRGCDNVAAYNFFVGKVKHGPEFPDGIGATDVRGFYTGNYSRSCDEIMKVRQQ